MGADEARGEFATGFWGGGADGSPIPKYPESDPQNAAIGFKTPRRRRAKKKR